MEHDYSDVVQSALQSCRYSPNGAPYQTQKQHVCDYVGRCASADHIAFLLSHYDFSENWCDPGVLTAILGAADAVTVAYTDTWLTDSENFDFELIDEVSLQTMVNLIYTVWFANDGKMRDRAAKLLVTLHTKKNARV